MEEKASKLTKLTPPPRPSSPLRGLAFYTPHSISPFSAADWTFTWLHSFCQGVNKQCGTKDLGRRSTIGNPNCTRPSILRVFPGCFSFQSHQLNLPHQSTNCKKLQRLQECADIVRKEDTHCRAVLFCCSFCQISGVPMQLNFFLRCPPPNPVARTRSSHSKSTLKGRGFFFNFNRPDSSSGQLESKKYG